jgi:hypothetical protein
MLVVLVGGVARAWLKPFNPVQIGPIAVDIKVNEYRWPDEFALWIKDHLPPGSAVFTFDWPGAMAYYSDRRILPMDGLMNDFKYNDDLLESGVEKYLCDHDVGYFFGLVEDGVPVQHVAVTAPLYRQPAGVLSLYEDDILVKVREVVERPDEALPFALWRLRCARTGHSPERASSWMSAASTARWISRRDDFQ